MMELLATKKILSSLFLGISIIGYSLIGQTPPTSLKNEESNQAITSLQSQITPSSVQPTNPPTSVSTKIISSSPLTSSNISNPSPSTKKESDTVSTFTPTRTDRDEVREPDAFIATNNVTEVMAWIYPGSPACNAKNEYSVRKISVLKPEYFIISDEGDLTLLTEESSGCNGYSLANIADIKKHSRDQYVTVSSSYSATMATFLEKALANPETVDTLVAFVVDNKITGVEIDFEDFGGWSKESYDNYKQFINALGTKLHRYNKKLMIDGPATSNQTEQEWLVWRYKDFKSLPVDTIVIMAYDYQFDQGVGTPISPLPWIKDVIVWTQSQLGNTKKISIGLPSYGYKGKVGSNRTTLLTYKELVGEVGFKTARRDQLSQEMTWENDGYVYFYQDSYSLSQKRKLIESLGITSVSVWHLGGNMWFE